MKVYVVVSMIPYEEGTYLEKIFDSRNKAEAHKKTLSPNLDYEILEGEVE